MFTPSPLFGLSSTLVHERMTLCPDAVARFFLANAALEQARATHDIVGGNETTADLPHQQQIQLQQRYAEAADALAAYRMDATNLPRDDGATRRSWDAFVSAMDRAPGLAAAYAACRAATARSAEVLGKPTADAFDCSQQDQMHLVAPGLFVGSYHPACDEASLRRHGVTHVLCCIDMPPRFPDAFEYMTLGADDRQLYNISAHFASTFAFIDGALAGGGSVLVHCGAGVSRAPTIAAAYLIQKLRVSAEAALLQVRAARACTRPNDGFRQQLLAYGKTALADRRSAAASACCSPATATFASPSVANSPAGGSLGCANDDDVDDECALPPASHSLPSAC